MKWLAPSVWLPALGALVLLLWLAGGELLEAWRVRTHEVAALAEPPRALFAAGVLLFTLGALSVFLRGVAGREDEHFRGYRLLPIVAFLALFVRLLMLNDGPVAPSPALTARALQAFAEALHTPDGALVQAPHELEAIAQRLGAPQYLVRGERLTSYRVAVRPPCEGPLTAPGDAGAGTLLVCFAQNGSRAWITAVALPADVRFGAPALFSMNEKVVVTTATARSETEQATELPAPARREESGG